MNMKKAWITICILWLIVGVALSIAGYMPNDVGIGVLYYPILMLLTLPIGFVIGIIYFFALYQLELFLFGAGTHIAEVANVCIAWVIMFYPSYWFWFQRGKNNVQQST